MHGQNHIKFLYIFWKNTQTSNFIKIRPVGTELFHADRETEESTDGQVEMTKVTIAFRNSANAPENRC